MNTDNLTDYEIIQLARECVQEDDFTTFSNLILSCRRQEGMSVSAVLRDIEESIHSSGSEAERDKFRQFKLSVEGAAEHLADEMGKSKEEVMEG